MKRAPNGYRIIQWADGFYHVYFGGECLVETLKHSHALQVAKDHKDKRAAPSEHARAQEFDSWEPGNVERETE